MQSRQLLAAALGMLMLSHTMVLVDWKSQLAKKTVGRAAQAGIEEALEDAVQDAAFDAALRVAGPDRRRSPVGRDAGSTMHRAALGSTAGDAVEAAMKAADVASSMETALDAAEAAKKLHRIQKGIQRFID